jgi:hypothetical protein
MSALPPTEAESLGCAITTAPTLATHPNDDQRHHVTDAVGVEMGYRVQELEEEKTFWQAHWPTLATAAGLAVALPFVFLYLLTVPNMVEAAVFVSVAVGTLIFGLGFYSGTSFRDIEEG